MGRFIAVLLCVILIVGAAMGGFGFYRGWFAVASDNQDGQTELTLKVNKNKITEDVNNARQQAQQVLGKNSVKGKLTAVKAAGVTIAPDEGKPAELAVNEKTVIKRHNTQIRLSDLKVGEIVMAVYMLEEDAKAARTITVVTK